jgi:hypothetical protein
MRAILFSFDTIPLDFLLIDAPRDGGFKNTDPDRWIPTQARGDAYSSLSVIESTSDGLSIVLEGSDSLFRLGGTGFNQINFTLSTWQPVEKRGSIVAAPLDILDIECLNLDQNSSHPADGQQAYILVEKLPSRGSTGVARGAIFYESRTEGEKVFLSYAYTIRARSRGDRSTAPDAYLQLASPRAKFYVERGEYTPQSRGSVP